MHVYVILSEEHKSIFSIFNHQQQVYEAAVFQMPVLHKHVQRYATYASDTVSTLKEIIQTAFILSTFRVEKRR